MNLMDIKHFFQRVKICSMTTLSNHFSASPELIRMRLEPWIRKGCIKFCERTPACAKSCGKCDFSSLEIYEWVEKTG